MIDYVISASVFALVVALNVVLTFIFKKREKKFNSQNNIMFQPIEYVYLCILQSFVCIILAIICYIVFAKILNLFTFVEGLALFCILTALSIGASAYIWVLYNWKLELKDQNLIYTNYLKKQKSFPIDNIEFKDVNTLTIFYFNNKRIFSINPLQNNYIEMTNTLIFYKTEQETREKRKSRKSKNK